MGVVGLDALPLTKVLDLILGAGAIVALFFILRSVGATPAISLLGAALFSSHVWLVRWVGSGMETSLAVLLSGLFLLFIIRRKLVPMAVCAGMLLLTRPESFVPLLVTSLTAMISDRPGGASPGRWVLYALGVAAIVLPWELFAYFHFGSIVPTTAMAKSGFRFSPAEVYETLIDLVQTMSVSDGFVVALGIVAYNVLPVRDRNRLTSVEKLLLVWYVSLPIYYVLTSTNVVSRYTLIVAPAIVVVSMMLVGKAIASGHVGAGAKRVLVTIALGSIVLNATFFEWKVRPQLEAFTEGMRDGFIAIGTWLKENTPVETRVLVGDVGAIGYYSERRVCDAAGLVTPEFIPLARKGYNAALLKYESAYRELKPVEYVVIPAREKETSWPDQLRPVLTCAIRGLRMTSNSPTYYTLLKVEDVRTHSPN
jgi:hypothetical protein